ncbi:MAG: amidohydrolase [Acidobacteria bacterium]|nr:amidohydrolase [Acidobacteriota bacterium]
MKQRLFWLAVVCLAGAVSLGGQTAGVDLVLKNGNIYTVDPRLGRVEALAIAQGKIVAAGTNDEIQHWVGPQTKIINLKGRFVMPGFNDAHTHFGSGSLGLLGFSRVNLVGTRSRSEFQERIRARVEQRPAEEWITGAGWDESLWKENRVPTRADLDALSTQHPMLFSRVDGHSVVVNSLALAKAGIARDTVPPWGGDIVKDGSGEPTGWLKDNAIDLVERLIPTPTREERKQALERVLAEAARYGITSVQDNSSWEDFLALKELKEEGKLTLRVTEWLPFLEPLEELERKRQEGGTTDPWLKTGALKGVTDGSGGSRSAAMLEPFADDPNNRGLLLIELKRLKKMVLERDAAGFQIALHAIGDRANRVALDAFAAAQKTNNRRNPRHKIEHAQFLDRDEVPRFKQLGVVASMQPSHLLSDMRWAPKILGAEREYEGYPWNSVAKAGGLLAFGTDFPVEPLNPLRGLYASVSREFEEGGPLGGWLPEEKVSIADAIRAYTWGSAYAEFEDHRKGTLAPGKFADLVVLTQDITEMPGSEILRTEVLLTMVGGKIVYEKQ